MKRPFLSFRKKLVPTQYIVLGALGFAISLGTWQVLVSAKLVVPYFLPSPANVLRATIDLFGKYDLWGDFRASFYRVTVGYVVAVALAVPLGVLIGAFAVFAALLEPFTGFVRYTPLPAFIPLIILWVGIGDLNQITIIFLGVFWSLIVLVADVVANVPRAFLETAATLGTNRFKTLTHVIIPSAMPGIYDSLRVAIGWAWSSLILAEIVGANSGIGHMIMESQRFLRTANVISGIILVGLLGLALDYLFKAAYRPLFPWAEKRL